ncbi:MAG TPA: hypothetical protein VE977_16800 [Pyrinomonadaceae bacterium]|nr:hypothetical protein [Pyrinomonadaceae bacterium]
MFRFVLLAMIVLICLASLSCQNYSSGLQQSVTRADETVATGALRTISVAQQTYSVSNEGNYGTFPELAAGGYLDERFNSDKPALRNYVLTMEVVKGSGAPFYSCNADPAGDGPQGRHFYMDSKSNGLHANPTQPATASDPVAQP